MFILFYCLVSESRKREQKTKEDIIQDCYLTLSAAATAYVTGHYQSHISKMTGQGAVCDRSRVVCDWLFH